MAFQGIQSSAYIVIGTTDNHSDQEAERVVIINTLYEGFS